MTSQTDRLMELVRRFAQPRFVGTDGSRKVREELLSFFRNLEFDTSIRRFDASKLPMFVMVRLGLILPAAGLWSIYSLIHALPWLVPPLAVLILILMMALTRWNRLMPYLYRNRFFGSFPAQNIIAARRSPNPEGTLVFTAHYDSKSQTMSIVVRFFLFLAVPLSAIAALLGSVLAVAEVLDRIWTFVPLLVLTGIVLALQINFTHNRSPGAFDNASGLAVLAALAESAEASVNTRLDLLFVATDAEEVGLCGAVHLAEELPGLISPGRCFVVNFDGCGGSGPIRLTNRYGFPPVHTGPELTSLCVEIARKLGMDCRKTWLITGAAMDHIPIAAAGYPSVTLSAGELNRTTLAMHSKNDVVENVDPAGLVSCFDIGRRIICAAWKNGLNGFESTTGEKLA